jgi:hypothetical protein
MLRSQLRARAVIQPHQGRRKAARVDVPCHSYKCVAPSCISKIYASFRLPLSTRSSAAQLLPLLGRPAGKLRSSNRLYRPPGVIKRPRVTRVPRRARERLRIRSRARSAAVYTALSMPNSSRRTCQMSFSTRRSRTCIAHEKRTTSSASRYTSERKRQTTNQQ